MPKTTHTPRPRRPIRGRVAAAVTVAAVVAVVAGCGSSAATTTTTATTSKQATAGTGTKAAKAHHAAAVHTRHHSHKASATQGPTAIKTQTHPAAQAQQPVVKAGALLSSIHGTGDQAIETLSPKATVVLEWSTTKPPIQMFTTRGFLLLNSPSATGSVRLAHGIYKGLHVATRGTWTLQIHASP